MKMKYIYSSEEIIEQRRLDTAERAEMWRRFEEKAGGGERGRAVTDAFRELYKNYDSKLAEWYASLYDKGVGGFYACTVGRDTVGFLPDLESTVQSLRFLQGSGLLRGFGGSYRDALPDWMIKQMVRYAKSIQDENGFFYHPQWSKESADIGISHRGRDLGWCTALLSEFGASPTYDAPNGMKGDGLDADGNPVVICGSAASCDGGETAPKANAAATSYADYLESDETFKAYLKANEERLRTYSYGFGNELNATYKQIKPRDEALRAQGADYSLCDILISWLNNHIIPSTGYWEDKQNYAGINGFFKIITLYNMWERPYPIEHIEAVTNSVVSCLASDEEAPYNICSIYNIWDAVCYIRTNTKFFDEPTRVKINGMIDDVLTSDLGVLAVRKTAAKLKKYRKSDGGFSHSYYRGCPNHQGLPVSSRLRENVGDTDATGIGSTGLTRGIFGAFGFERIPLLMHSDYMVFRNILENLPPVTKTKVQNPLVDFEDGELYASPVSGGKLEIAVDGGNRVLRLTAGEGDGLVFYLTATQYAGRRLICSFDLKPEEASDGAVLSLKLMNLKNVAPVYLYLTVSDGVLHAHNEELGLSSVPICEVGKWARLKLVYTVSEGAGSTALYLNGAHVGTVTNKDGCPEHPAGYNPHAFEKASLILDRGKGITLAVDNLSYFLAEDGE